MILRIKSEGMLFRIALYRLRARLFLPRQLAGLLVGPSEHAGQHGEGDNDGGNDNDSSDRHVFLPSEYARAPSHHNRGTDLTWINSV